MYKHSKYSSLDWKTLHLKSVTVIWIVKACGLIWKSRNAVFVVLINWLLLRVNVHTSSNSKCRQSVMLLLAVLTVLINQKNCRQSSIRAKRGEKKNHDQNLTDTTSLTIPEGTESLKARRQSGFKDYIWRVKRAPWHTRFNVYDLELIWFRFWETKIRLPLELLCGIS